MERGIEIFAAVNFFIMGLSHIVKHRAWAEFFVRLRDSGAAGGFANGFLNLFTGSLIVGFHNVWTGFPAVLTVIGWLSIVKSLLIFTVPGYETKTMRLVSVERSRMFIWPGIVLVLLSAGLIYSLLT